MVSGAPESIRILLVEDDDAHVELIRRALEAADDAFELTVATTLLQAKELRHSCNYKVTITDYRLPDGEGIELLTEGNNCCPVILLTAQGNEHLAVEAMKAGTADYLVKSPDLFAAIPRIVRRTLREWQLLEEQNKSAQQILKAKNEWEETFDAIPDLIAIIDGNHRIERVNKALCQRSGLPPEELVGRACYEVVHGSSSPPDSCPHKRLLQQQTYQSNEMNAELLDGVFDVSVAPLFNPDGSIRGCVHIARDITPRLQAEKEKAALEDQLRHAQRMQSIGILASGVAHDFNNIITAIVGYAHIIALGLPQDSPLREHATQIMEATGRAAKLTADLLQFSRRDPFTPQIIALSQVLSNANSLLQRLAGNNITIELQTNHQMQGMLYGDKLQLAQVAMNLVSNARDAMPEGGVISIRLDEVHLDTEHAGMLGLAASGSYLRLLFSDTGCGIPKDKIGHIFDPFFTTKEPGKGTGLGLSIVYGIIRNHNGSITADSIPGTGTTLTIHLPAAAPTQ